jgi:oligosaccharide repeat unit polymerase
MVSWKLIRAELFHPCALFLGSAFVFNAGQAVLEVFGANPDGMLKGAFSDQTMRESLVLVFSGLASLLLASLVGVVAWGGDAPRRHKASPARSLRLIGWTLVLVSLPSTIMWVAECISIASVAGYGGLYDRELQSSVVGSPLVLGSFFVPGVMLLTVAATRHPADGVAATVLVLLYAGVHFYLGYRATAAMPLVAWAWLRHRMIKPIRMAPLIAAGAILILIVFPLVRDTRNIALRERSVSIVREWFGVVDNPAIVSISEMGGTFVTVAHTVGLVPATRDYEYGKSYIYALVTLFPNLFWDVHPTIVWGTNSDWLAYAVDPVGASRGGGIGFSFIAEAYLNFGRFGPLFVLFSIGLAITRVSTWAEGTQDPAKLALVATMLAFILRFPRDESVSILRAVLWYGVGPYLATVLLPKIASVAQGRVPRPRALRPTVPLQVSNPSEQPVRE